MRKKFLLISMCVLFALSLSSISFAQEGEPIKVGAVFDLTGATADVSTPYSYGMRAYVDWLNANGGIGGRPIELIWEDYAYEVPNAENLYEQFVGEGVVAFMGWGTGDTEALRPRIAENEIPFMSASYSAALNDPAGEAPYNFLVGTTYSDQLVILLQFFLDMWVEEGNDPADMHVAFFHNDSPFGTSPLPDGEAFAAENGFATVRVAMPRGATDFTAELENADAELEGITHIIVQNVSSPAALLFRNVVDAGFEDVALGCLNWCADELMVSLSEGAGEGVYGAVPFSPIGDLSGHELPATSLEGSDQYASLEEATLHYSQGWWTMAVMAEGMRMVVDSGQEVTGPNIKAALETLENFDTGVVTAPITFTADDHRGNRALV
ncbi:MAG: ABC transporter substrate-binding protein, partial [Anaerolineae bacterium]|nr:ABC transporter substrate-binding protein [Anaerolineae bacterium]